ncbi:L-lysine 2,3-aminomutase [Sulfidibacter corallicola]|uniref:KamA family radical SAM protein n=1 Tax=Sulfidibacter corallicola TaxID=2818388 RepID=UPI003B20DDBC
MCGCSFLKPKVFQAYSRKNIDKIPQLQKLSKDHLTAIKAVSSVLPFRVNNYVLEELIDWNRVPEDPMFQLTIPQPGMLTDEDLYSVADLIQRGEPDQTVMAQARRIQMKLNPHPAGQMELNVPVEQGDRIQGIQHKYKETVLFFPGQGQTCHAYCTYCFRWAQFVGIDDLKFASREAEVLVDYLRKHPEVTDVLFTGGDPMIMKTRLLRRYIEPLLEADLPHLQTIRIGTKAPAYWPFRFVTDRDADDLMLLFEEVIKRGKHLALMAHFSHPRELETPAAQAAIKRIRGTGAVVRCQAPLIRNVNDSSAVWNRMWGEQVKLGAIPYYMFVERDTGPKHYFEVPLHRAFEIFSDAYRAISGVARTVRGPSMSATPGKVLVDGIAEIGGQKVFVLKFIQGRDPEWVNRVFFAEYDEKAAWLDQLRPAFGEDRFFFEKQLADIKSQKTPQAEGSLSAFEPMPLEPVAS